MKVLVTGSSGFVGRNMAARLIADGHEVLGVDIVPPAPGGRLAFVEKDVRDFFESSTIAYDLVVHCAAVVGGRVMIDGAPLLLAAEDLSIDAALFRWLLRQKGTPPKVVYFSSSAAYPVERQNETLAKMVREGRLKPGDLLLDEDQIELPSEADDGHVPEVLWPDQTYGWVKLTGERMADEARMMGLPVYVFRPFSGYGPDQDEDYPFPAFISRAMARDNPFEVWGTGEQVRDFVHIDDVVSAVLARLDSDDTAPVNIGTGRATSFLELAQICIDEENRRHPESPIYDPHIETHPDAPVGVAWRVAETSRLRSFYQPKITLEEGVRQAMEAHPWSSTN